MFELDTMNPDVKLAEVAYRRDQLTTPRVTSSRRRLRLRARRTTSPRV